MMNYIIETHHLKKIYKDKAVVNDVNIHVKKGEIYGFVGPNGAGKSTLMKMLLNLVQSNSGEIVIFGNKVVENDFEMLKRIGSIIENPYFYEKLTARENLDLHCEYMGYHNKNHIKEVLECVGLLKDADKKVSQYSLGMKQRLAIARAILTKPELLILDEPINALDPEGIREMRELFRKLNTDYGTTIFISSHILSEVEQIADKIGIIQNGKLIKEISMSDVHKYRTDYVEIDVDNVELAGYLLEHELQIQDFRIITENRIEIYDLSKSIKNISSILVQNSIGINSIGRKQNSLEDYFFQITDTKAGEKV
ncbi:ABC transporter ATP-binding protein [Longicatena caecimuris]|uniref:ABC transporter ATP-binding protein n=1 Tax=Blautia caccae TaxID=3133175 RepID=UPI0022E8E928|nr:ABC transporter ATP-binding protein [Longicatena caecimuris]